MNQTRKMLRRAIKEGRIKLSKREYKRVEELVDSLPIWWSRQGDKDAHDHFMDGVFEGFILCLANVKPFKTKVRDSRG